MLTVLNVLDRWRSRREGLPVIGLTRDVTALGELSEHIELTSVSNAVVVLPCRQCGFSQLWESIPFPRRGI